MRRCLTALIAASLALSPVAIVGVTSGISAAHADLGWCDDCEIAQPIRAPMPVLLPPSLAPAAPTTPLFGSQP